MDRQLSDLSEPELEFALERLALLKPFLDHGVPLPRISEDSGISLRTLRRWAAYYRAEGIAGLTRRERSDKGKSGVPEEVRTLVRLLAVSSPKRTVAGIYRKASKIASANDLPEPSYDQVYGIVKGVDPQLVKLAQEGTKAYKQAYDMLYMREADRPNEIWQADHTGLNIWCKDDKGKPKKPWLTAIEDDHSRAISGYYLSFDSPSAIQTALALRQAIWRKEEPAWQICGIPETFYTDHGSDFTSNHIEQVAAELPMHLVFSTPGEPRGRGKVERFFRTVKEVFSPEVPGYDPREPINGRSRGRGGERPEPKLTLPQLDRMFRSWLLNDYHGQPREQESQTPVERWQAGGFLPRMPDSLEQLDLLLLTESKPRMVRKDGIHFHNHRYLDTVLASYVGEQVTIRYDPRDIAEIRIYLRGAFLCRAICPELSGQKVSLKEIRSATARRRRELRQQIKDMEATAEELLDLKRNEFPEDNISMAGLETMPAPFSGSQSSEKDAGPERAGTENKGSRRSGKRLKRYSSD